MSEREVVACPFCGEEILAVAKKCKHCGEFLDESARPPVAIDAEVAKAQKLRIQETTVCTVNLGGESGTLTLTTKKIRGKVNARTKMPDGRSVVSVKDIDVLLNLVISTEVIRLHKFADGWKALLIIIAFGIVCLLCGGENGFIISLILGVIFLILALIEEYFLVISIGGQEIMVKTTDRDVACKFVEEIRKQKAEYELKAGL